MSPLEKNRHSGNDEHNSGKRECFYMDDITSRDDERRLQLAREQKRNRTGSVSVNWRQNGDGNRDWMRNVPGKMPGKNQRRVGEWV
jgi:hypothetical protein